MSWETITIPAGFECYSEPLRTFASALKSVGSESEDFSKLRLKAIAHTSNFLRATCLLLCDLAEHGREVRTRVGAVQFSSEPIEQPPADSKFETRRRLHAARAYQLKKSATREFIRSLEKRRLFNSDWVSIFSLMRDGEELASNLKRVAMAEIKPENAIRPYLQVVMPDSICAFTGIPLMSIWRYFRHTWATPYKSVPGRSLLLLVRDSAAPHHPVIGIAALASSAAQLMLRDEWIGWQPEKIVDALRSDATEVDINWLRNTTVEYLDEIYKDDLLSPTLGPLTPRHMSHPTASIIKWLQDYADEQREVHGKNSSSAREHKNIDAAGHDEKLWRERAETALFRSKRAETLAVLLRALTVLLSESGGTVSAQELRSRLQSPTLVSAARSPRIPL